MQTAGQQYCPHVLHVPSIHNTRDGMIERKNMYTAMESEIYGKDKVDESAHDLKLFNLLWTPHFRLAQCVSHSMASSIFIWKIDFYWLFEKNDLESPLIFVLFLKG